jgi:hypothetical protein
VVGDDCQAGASLFQGVNVRADENVFVAGVFELFIGLRVEMKICTNPCATVRKGTVFVRCHAIPRTGIARMGSMTI